MLSNPELLEKSKHLLVATNITKPEEEYITHIILLLTEGCSIKPTINKLGLQIQLGILNKHIMKTQYKLSPEQ